MFLKRNAPNVGFFETKVGGLGKGSTQKFLLRLFDKLVTMDPTGIW